MKDWLMYLVGIFVLATFFIAPPALAQNSAPSQDQFTNRVLRDVIIPMNDPPVPDTIPVGHEVRMPDGSTHTVKVGEDLWTVTQRFVEENDLYEGWVKAGTPSVQPFVHASLSERSDLEREFTKLQTERDSLAAVVDSLSTEIEGQQQEGGFSWGWLVFLGVLVLAILATVGFVYSTAGRDRSDR